MNTEGTENVEATRSVASEPSGAQVRSSDWLAAINDQLDKRLEEMKLEFLACQTASQKNALGTAIITVNAIAWALRDAQKQMAVNDRTERPEAK